MGKRIRAARWFIHALRHVEQPRYAFEHAVANILLGAVGFALIIFDEHRLWAELFAVLMISIGVQGFRAWWFMHKRNREHEEYLRRRMREDADA